MERIYGGDGNFDPPACQVEYPENLGSILHACHFNIKYKIWYICAQAHKFYKIEKVSSAKLTPKPSELIPKLSMTQ